MSHRDVYFWPIKFACSCIPIRDLHTQTVQFTDKVASARRGTRMGLPTKTTRTRLQKTALLSAARAQQRIQKVLRLGDSAYKILQRVFINAV